MSKDRQTDKIEIGKGKMGGRTGGEMGNLTEG
jgi:hypothetical protein